MTLRPITNFKDSNGVDLGQKLVPKDYLISVYPSIGQQIGIPPELWTWGTNANARLGTNDTTSRSTPTTTFAGGTNWKQASCGFSWTTAIKTDGTLWVWGTGGSGRLGNANTSNRSTPVTTFAGGNNWKFVDAGNRFTAAIKTDGTLWIWGESANAKLGTNDISPNRSTPVTTFAGGTNWKQVSLGYSHAAAIKTDGTLWVWGDGSYGKLGTNDVNITKSTPVTTFAGGTNWKQVSTSDDHTAAIKTDGTLWVWGRGHIGQLGTNDTTNRSTPVTTFAGGTNWKQVTCGDAWNASIKTDGTLWTWGGNGSAELGTNDATNRSTPVTTFAGGSNWKQVSGKNDHVLAIKTDGTLWGWGDNVSGQLGTNDENNRSTPVTTFTGGTNWKQVSVGEFHSVAIRSVDF